MTNPILHLDFETRSKADLKVVGLHRYARDPSTEPWCMAFSFDDEEPVLWRLGEPLPQRVREHVAAGLPVYAHNAPFELEIWNQVCAPRYGWPELKPEQTFCTMAMGYAMGLPGALEDIALALGLRYLKDTQGHAIMLRAARPWKIDPDGAPHWLDECPELTIGGVKMTGKEAIARLFAYCQQDVRVEREVHSRVMPLSATERRVWLLDYKINQRGARIDYESVQAAIRLAETVKEQAGVKLSYITGGAVTSATALPALKSWMAERGVQSATGGLAKQDIVDLLADDTLPKEVRQALVIRQEVGKASTAKFDTMINRVGKDHRIRQMYQYHGAGPGRWAGRGVQTHNLVRDMPPAKTVEHILRLIREGQHEAIDMIYGPPLTMTSRCMRSFFVPSPGCQYVTGDWANVEGRGQAWFAGEDWKIRAFIAADRKEGPGMYELAYSRMFGVPVESVKNPSEERQVGKVSELAFGYQGGVGSFHTMGKNYGVKVPDAQAEGFKTAWRAAHPKIVQVWKDIEKAAINAVRNPGHAFSAGYTGREATFKMVGSFLWLKLPSQRVICYPYPKLLEGAYGPQLTYMVQPSQEDRKKGKIIDDPQNSVRWVRMGTYGGSLFNNIIQGMCRDFLADCMLRLDEKGAMIALHTHDSIALEVATEKCPGARVGMEKEMRTLPAWAAGFPLFAECEIEARFRG